MAVTVIQTGGRVIDNDTIRCAVTMYLNGQIGMFDLTYICDPVLGTGVTLDQIALAIQNALDTALQALVCIETDIIGTKASLVYRAGGGLKPLPGIAGSTSVGSEANPSAPTQASGLITWLSIISGPSGRGRAYIPFPATADVIAGTSPSANYITHLNTLITAISGINGVIIGTSPNTCKITQVIFHRATNTSTLVTSGVARPRWATQKRRGDYGRANARPW